MKKKFIKQINLFKIKSSHKIITVSILKPIRAGIEKNEFKKILEKTIYSELDLLN